jgi:ribose/xylose/arabinose/galactoside ABC-type transport system permease subunit
MKKELGITILLVVLCVIVTAVNPRFLGASNLTNMARLIGMYGIFSIGMGLVIITGGIDLSIGSVFALQGIILAIMLREWNWPWPIAVVATVVGTMLLGAMHGFFIAKVRMQAFIVTLCGLLFYRGMARFIANEMKTNRWFAKYETGSDRFGEQVSRFEFQGFDSLEDAQAFCEKNALDVEPALRGGTRPPETP